MTSYPPPDGAHGPPQPQPQQPQQGWPPQQQQGWPQQPPAQPTQPQHQPAWSGQQQGPQAQGQGWQQAGQQGPQAQGQGWQQAGQGGVATLEHSYGQQPQTGAYGYSYGPMPTYPQPAFPPQQPQKARIPAWVWIIAATLVIAVVTVFTLPAMLARGDAPDPDPTDDPTVEPTDGYGDPNTTSSGTFTGEHMVRTINEALAAKDRAAFFRFVDQDATAPLSLWWDNMDVLQWSAGAFSVTPNQADAYVDDTITLRVTLGAVTAGSPTIPAESDHPDAGKAYAPSNLYNATIQVTDDGESGVIVGWELAETAAPWDLEPLYAVVSEHSVTAGYADEQALVDRVAPMSEVGAAWVIETFEAETGVANAQRFATFVTEDPDRFNSWFIGETSGWVGDRAGTMFPQRRPYPAPGMAENIATGNASTNAGGILTIGPNGLLYGDGDTQDTIVHEFVHAIHTTNIPANSWPGSPVMEGWANYNESLFHSDGEFGARFSYIGNVVRGCVASEGFSGEFPTQQDFVDVETVHCAYSLSGSMYAYAASLGVDVYAMADLALKEGDSLPEVIAASGGPTLDAGGWTQWLRANFT